MPQLMAEAKKRQETTWAKPGEAADKRASVSSNTDAEPSFRSRQAAAEIADVPPQTIQRAWEVTKADPELAKIR